ncbi:MAG TPA: SURF1 family protein [Rhizomicrobium sp.]|jgi:surfeit locus 1 family protein
MVFRPLWKFTAFMAVLFAGFVALGVWQLERLQWKLGLIAEVNQNLKAPPISAAEAFALGPRGAQYHRVELAGRFGNAKETYVYTTDNSGDPVYHVVVPFTLDDGRVLMVDRGMVPQSMRDPKTRAAGAREGEQHITGVWRVPDPPGLFTPPPDLKHRIWFSRDVSAMAKVDGVKLAAPVIVEADAAPNPGGWPEGGQTVVTFRNDHLQYAITWFAMAAIVGCGWVAFHVSRGRIRRI